jgi:AcrR family transcriptional regulator
MPRIVTTYKQEARKRILDAALVVFKEKGYFKSTMDDVANKVGVSKSAIYQYFDGKDQLLAALYTSGPENLRSQFTQASKKGPVAAAKEVFERMGTKENADLFLDFMAEASRNEDLQKLLRSNIGRFSAVIEDMLKERNPRMKPEEVERVHQIVAMMGLIYNGLASWLAIGVPEAEVRKVWEGSVNMLLGPYEGKGSRMPD